MPEEFQLTRADVKELQGHVARLTTLIETEGERCPYREAIARASNNRRQIEKNTADIEEVEKRVNALDVSTARMLVMLTGSGGLGGAIVAAVMSLLSKGG